MHPGVDDPGTGCGPGTLLRDFVSTRQNLAARRRQARAQLEPIVDLCGLAGIAGRGGGEAEVDVERGNHCLHPSVTVGRAEFRRETRLDDLKRDVG